MQIARRLTRCFFFYLAIAFTLVANWVYSSDSSQSPSTNYSFNESYDVANTTEARINIPQITFGSASLGQLRLRHKEGSGIQSIKTTCGCTAAKVSKSGESESVIVVEIRPSTPKSVSSQIKVEMQDGSLMQINITATVISKVAITPPAATIKDSIAVPLTFSSSLTDLSTSTVTCLDDRFVFETTKRSSSQITGVMQLSSPDKDQEVGLAESITFLVNDGKEDHKMTLQLRRLIPKRFIPSNQRVNVESPTAFALVVFADKQTAMSWSGRFRIGNLFNGSVSRTTEKSVVVEMTPQATEFFEFRTESQFDVEVEIQEPTGTAWHSIGKIRLTPL